MSDAPSQVDAPVMPDAPIKSPPDAMIATPPDAMIATPPDAPVPTPDAHVSIPDAPIISSPDAHAPAPRSPSSPDATPDAPILGPLASFAITSQATNVDEHAQFALHLEAQDASGQTRTDYHGAPTLNADWGDLTVVSPIVFQDGQADVTVSLDRETSPTHPAVIITALDGPITGMTAIGIAVVTAPSWTVLDTTPVFQGRTNTSTPSWDSSISKARWLRRNDEYMLWYLGSNPGDDSFSPGVGVATSSDGMTWTRESTVMPVLTTATSGWDNGIAVTDFFVAPDQSNLIGVYYLQQSDIWGVVHSPDGITWTRGTQGFAPANNGPCESIDDHPTTLVSERSSFEVYFEVQANPCYSVSVFNDGAGWSSLNPTSGISSTGYLEVTAIIKEGTVYKMWYRLSQEGDPTFLLYATSTDEATWIPSPSKSIAPIFDTVLQNEVTGAYEALFESAQGGFSRMSRP